MGSGGEVRLACVCVCVHVCVRACVCVCVGGLCMSSHVPDSPMLASFA